MTKLWILVPLVGAIGALAHDDMTVDRCLDHGGAFRNGICEGATIGTNS